MNSDIDKYLNKLPAAQGVVMERLRGKIKSIVSEAVETMSSNVPAFRYKGKYLVSFSAAKNHLALLVMQGNT